MACFDGVHGEQRWLHSSMEVTFAALDIRKTPTALYYLSCYCACDYTAS
jgi:hypothetical protein